MIAPQEPNTLARRLKHRTVELMPSWLLVRRGPAGARRVALTFDDGPDPLTRRYLDVLDAYGVSATFFVVGVPCRAYPDDLREIVRRGHEVAGHGKTHLSFPTLDAAALHEELRSTAELLPPARGRAMVRPPHGATTLRSLMRCAAEGYTTVLWSLDSDDCRTRDPRVVEAAVAPDKVTPGEIVLLHEGQEWTLEALPRIITSLREARYELVTVSALLAGR